MHNIEASGYLVIGGFGKTLADMRRFVALADMYRLPDSTPCNAVVNCRVDAETVQPSMFGAILHYSWQQPGQEAGR